MARGNDRGYLHGDRVRLKKYLYVLRPLLAVRWLESGRGVVPMPFHELVETLIPPGELRDAIERLLRLKQGGEELGLGAAHSGLERLDQGGTGAADRGSRRAGTHSQTGPGTARCPVSGVAGGRNHRVLMSGGPRRAANFRGSVALSPPDCPRWPLATTAAGSRRHRLRPGAVPNPPSGAAGSPWSLARCGDPDPIWR